jgi:hypothetical protein
MVDLSLDKIDFSELRVSREDIENWVDNNNDILKQEDIRQLWVDLQVNVLSTVENPAHPSEVLAMKSEDGDSYTREVPALKSEDEQIIKAPAMVADRPDREGDLVPSPVVEASAHDFLKNKRIDEVDSDHETPIGSEQSLTERGSVVESWILAEDKSYETVDGDSIDYQEGDWMVKIEITDDETWDRFKSGELTGLSIMGRPEFVELSNTVIQDEDNNKDMTEEKESMEEVAEMVSDLISDMDKNDAMTMLERMDNDDDNADEDSMHGEDEDEEDDEDEKDIPTEVLEEAQLLFSDEERAEAIAGLLGMEGTHTHELDGEEFYMPAENHDEYEDALDEIEEEDMHGEDEDEEDDEDEDSMHEDKDEEIEEDLDNPEFSSGDAVMWSSQDTPVHGRVNDTHEQYSPAEGVTITGEEGEAVYSIYEYDDSLENPVFRDSPSDPNIAKPESSLSESTKDMPPASDENFGTENEEEEKDQEKEETEEEKEIDRVVSEEPQGEETVGEEDVDDRFKGLMDY